MQVDHRNYEIPHKIGPIGIRPLSWKDFKAPPPPHSPFLAHIYWTVSYEFESVSQGQPTIKVNVSVRPKSWKIVEELELLKHEYGHYLIGCLCGLSFAKKVNFDLTWNPRTNFGVWCREVLGQCLKQYCELQKLYDQQTDHYLNGQMQESWQKKIKEQLLEFDDFFKSKRKQEKRKGDKRLTEVNQNNNFNNCANQKVKKINTGSRKFNIRKDLNNQVSKCQRKDANANKSLNHKNQVQPINQIYNSKDGVLAKIRYNKKFEENDNHGSNKPQNIPKKSSIAMRPLTTWLKPL